MLEELIGRYPVLEPCRESIRQAYQALEECFLAGGKLLVAGNGGSAADSDHIVGELMKGFVKKRPLPDSLVQALKEADPQRGAELSQNNARYLISVSGCDIKTLLNEVQKLSAFANGAQITKEMIDKLAVKCLQARIYDLSNAVVRGNYDKAYAVLDSLFAAKEDPVKVLSAISGCFVDMYRVKCAKTAGMPFDDVASYFNYRGREFALKNASRDSAALSFDQLRRSLDVIMLADNGLKSTSADSRLILEEMLVKLLLISKEVRYD